MPKPNCKYCGKNDKVAKEFQCPECGAKTYTCSRCKVMWSIPETKDAKRKFLVLRRVLILHKEGKYTESQLLHFMAGYCHFAPKEEDVKLLEELAGDKR